MWNILPFFYCRQKYTIIFYLSAGYQFQGKKNWTTKNGLQSSPILTMWSSYFWSISTILKTNRICSDEKNSNKYSNKTGKTFESEKKRIFGVSELVVVFSQQDIASHQSSKVWKISMFVFGSNENFEICVQVLLTFIIYIFVNLKFWYFSYFLTQMTCNILLTEYNNRFRNSKKSGFFWSKSLLLLFEYLSFFFIRNNLICLKNRENYNTTSDNVEPIVSCLGKVVYELSSTNLR